MDKDNTKAIENQIIKDSDIDINKEEDTEERKYSGILSNYKDENSNIYYYQFHRKIGDKIDLRCKDRKCHGTASINHNDIITIKTKCDLPYTSHNYIKEINAYNRIKNNEEIEEQMKDEIFQIMYIKINIEKFPLIKYEEIFYELNLKYPNLNKIHFSKSKYNNLKNKILREIKDNNHNLNLIDNIEL
jgi:hypothetical protein